VIAFALLIGLIVLAIGTAGVLLLELRRETREEDARRARLARVFDGPHLDDWRNPE
jgi:hypothetical protein